MGGKKFEKRGMIAFAGEEQTFSEEGKKIRDRFASKEFFFGRNKWREGGGRWFGKKLEIYLNRSCEFRIVVATSNVCISRGLMEGGDDYPGKRRNLERGKKEK